MRRSQYVLPAQPTTTLVSSVTAVDVCMFVRPRRRCVVRMYGVWRPVAGGRDAREL